MLGNVMHAAGAALMAFRRAMFSADPQGGNIGRNRFDTWNRWESRKVRYQLYWALYESTAYQDKVHLFSRPWKAELGLYKHTRALYNPAYRIGEFWAGHLMAGLLDPAAGDGESAPSALPILTENPAIRPAIARLWADSRWQVAKETYTRWGSVLGDVGLKVVDDRARKQVRLEVVHPGHLRWVDFDATGNVKSYILDRWERDPRKADISTVDPMVDLDLRDTPVRYQEKAYRDGDDVVYETYLDGKLYPWNGVEATWREPYGFIPLVVAQHESIGLNWGANAWHAGSGDRFTEVDDQASGLSDQIKKAIRMPTFFAGVQGPRHLQTGKEGGDQGSPGQRGPEGRGGDQGKSEVGFLYGPLHATATPLVFPVDIEGVCEHIDRLNAGIEKNFPELLADTGNLGGTVTAEAIRNARQQASSKVQSRRVSYDDPLVRAQMMALSIGGMQGYPDFEAFSLESFAAGDLDHQIGQRAVFEVDPLDSIEEDQAFWTAAGAAVQAGLPLAVYLERNGWSAEEVKQVADAKAAEPKPAAAPATTGDHSEATSSIGTTAQADRADGDGARRLRPRAKPGGVFARRMSARPGV